ncbi:unnamed protein product [Closterium sp. Naga37s-1]|nr:unnamed protein product [Closterium sp. Naga37s-1]
MPPKARSAKPVKPAMMDPAAAAVTLATPAAGPSSRPISASAVPSKSARTLFAEDDTVFLTLSAKLAAIRIEQAAGGKQDNGKGKDADFKDAVSDAEEDHSAEEVEGVESGAARRTCFLDDEDDGLLAHDPKECFEEKAKEELAAKLRFPLTLLIPNDRLQEVRRTQATVKELLSLWVNCNELTENAAKTTTFQDLNPGYIAKKLYGPAATVATATTKIVLKDHALVLISTTSNREEWVCLLECCEKGKGGSFEQAAHHVLSQRHRGGLAKQGAATRVLKANLSLRVLRKEYGV